MWELMKGELKKSDANKQNFISDTWKKEGRVFNQFLHMAFLEDGKADTVLLLQRMSSRKLERGVTWSGS